MLQYETKANIGNMTAISSDTK